LLVKELAERMNRGGSLGLPAGLPALALAVALASTGLGIASNVLSRQVEARADAFGLNLTRDPAAFIGLERSLALTNLAEPNPPRVFHILFGTHPTTMERIGMGLTWARGH
jgi:STE24 endopeptidase